ncbi:MAG: hypothetical protein AAFO69_12765 [Bacteroidota bacterium]
MIRILPILVLLSAMYACKNQKVQDSMWKESKMEEYSDVITPVRFRTYELKESQMRSSLEACGTEQQKASLIRIPDPQGNQKEFQVWKSKVANPALIEKYPNLQTYQGVAVESTATRIRIENSDNGIQAMVIDAEGTWYIEPAVDSRGSYIVYYKADLPADSKNFWSDKVIKEYQP